jgi:hypothetical protein
LRRFITNIGDLADNSSQNLRNPLACSFNLSIKLMFIGSLRDCRLKARPPGARRVQPNADASTVSDDRSLTIGQPPIQAGPRQHPLSCEAPSRGVAAATKDHALMSNPPKFPVGPTVAAFHEIAARRGDGLHPLLLEALGRSGQVSGPPRPSEQSDENIIRLDFGDTRSGRTRPRAVPR